MPLLSREFSIFEFYHSCLTPIRSKSMALSLALRRAASSPLLTKLVSPIRVASASRSFNTDAQVADYDDGEDRRSVSRPRYSPSNLFADALGPFSRTRSLIQALNLMEHFMKSPLVEATRDMGAVSRRGWDVKEEKDALFVKMDMPGLGKEDVKVSVERNTLIIKGEGGKESENDETGRKYTSRIDLPAKLYKFDEIKSEMKNGVLKVVVPKVEEDGGKMRSKLISTEVHPSVCASKFFTQGFVFPFI